MKNMNNRVTRRRRGQGGFTLIELLVVIAILGILAAIVVLNVTGTKSNAQLATCRANTQAVQSAVDGYYINNNSYPTAGGSQVDTSALLTGTNPYLQSDPTDNGTYSFSYTNSTGTVQGIIVSSKTPCTPS